MTERQKELIGKLMAEDIPFVTDIAFNGFRMYSFDTIGFYFKWTITKEKFFYLSKDKPYSEYLLNEVTDVVIIDIIKALLER